MSGKVITAAAVALTVGTVATTGVAAWRVAGGSTSIATSTATSTANPSTTPDPSPNFGSDGRPAAEPSRPRPWPPDGGQGFTPSPSPSPNPNPSPEPRPRTPTLAERVASEWVTPYLDGAPPPGPPPPAPPEPAPARRRRGARAQPHPGEQAAAVAGDGTAAL